MQNVNINLKRFVVAFGAAMVMTITGTANAETKSLLDICSKSQEEWYSSPDNFIKWFKDHYLKGIPKPPPETYFVWSAKFNGFTAGRSVLDTPIFIVPTPGFNFSKPPPVGHFFVKAASDDKKNWRSLTKGQTIRVAIPWNGNFKTMKEVDASGNLVTTGVVIYLENARLCPDSSQ